jgi:iron(III) transport system ATP-binding protein
VVLAIRPESWHLALVAGAKLAPADDGLRGHVKQATYLGGSYEYTVSTELGDVFLISPLRAGVAKTGDAVTLRLFSQGVAVLAE